ncbi:MAG: thioredoxin domain-containing protein [Segetibacter sp.]
MQQIHSLKYATPISGPCAKAHPKIDKLLEEIPNLKVKIIFTTPNKPEQPAYKPVCHLLAIAAKSNTEKITMKALDDWYLADKKDYELFAAKYPMNGELLKQGDKMEAMDKWSNKMEVSVTPTIFINGYQLPDAYSIEDLQYFLLE